MPRGAARLATAVRFSTIEKLWLEDAVRCARARVRRSRLTRWRARRCRARSQREDQIQPTGEQEVSDRHNITNTHVTHRHLTRVGQRSVRRRRIKFETERLDVDAGDGRDPSGGRDERDLKDKRPDSCSKPADILAVRQIHVKSLRRDWDRVSVKVLGEEDRELLQRHWVVGVRDKASNEVQVVDSGGEVDGRGRLSRTEEETIVVEADSEDTDLDSERTVKEKRASAAVESAFSDERLTSGW